MKRQSGVTLIELLIAVVVLGILAAIAMPAYANHARKAKILEAVANLESARSAMIHYYGDSRSYSSVNPATENAPTCGAAMPVATKYFTFQCTVDHVDAMGNATDFEITAAGIGDMAGFNYSIEDEGDRESKIQAPATSLGWSNPSPNKCWTTGPGGAC